MMISTDITVRATVVMADQTSGDPALLLNNHRQKVVDLMVPAM